MAAKKFLRMVSGKLKEVFATVTSAGAGNDGDIVALDSTGKLDISLLPVGVGAEVTVLPASENLTAGDFVNLWNDGGTMKVRKADATTNAKPADGFVLAGVTAPANATVYRLSQTNTARSGMTLGAEYFLSTTAGGITTTAPSANGNIVQRIGVAHSATEIVFDNVITVEVVA